MVQTVFYKSRRAFQGKVFLKRKTEKGNMVEKVPSFRSKSSSGLSKQHSTLPEEQDFLTSFFVLFFALWGRNCVSFSQTPCILSQHLTNNNPRKMFLWTRNWEKNLEIEERFSRSFGWTFRRGSEKWNPKVHRSIFRYYFFLQRSSIFDTFPYLERKFSPLQAIFFSIFFGTRFM